MERDYSGYLGIDGRITLKWISRSGVGHGLNCFGPREGQVVGFCECGNEPSRSIKCAETLN